MIKHPVLITLFVITFAVAFDATSIALAFTVIFLHHTLRRPYTHAVAQAITKDLNGNTAESFWSGTSFLLAACISQPIFSSLSDIFRSKIIILIATSIFAIGSLVCFDPGSMAILLIGRCIQGLGAGGLMVLSNIIIFNMIRAEIIPLDKFGNCLLYPNLGTALGTVCGPLIGGALGSENNWVRCMIGSWCLD